jgi:hypothetical protein
VGANDKLAATFHSGNTDPRLEPVRRELSKGLYQMAPGELPAQNGAVRALAAADEADRAAGIVRVRVDDDTVERAARALQSEAPVAWIWDSVNEETKEFRRSQARIILAALRGES